MDKRIFKRSEVDVNRRAGWVVDLNDPQSSTITEDAYWYFRTRKAATEFLKLVDNGMDVERAIEQATEAHISGTAPDTSLHLGAERRAWLIKRGRVQPVIHRLIDAAMETERDWQVAALIALIEKEGE